MLDPFETSDPVFNGDSTIIDDLVHQIVESISIQIFPDAVDIEGRYWRLCKQHAPPAATRVCIRLRKNRFAMVSKFVITQE